MELKWKDIGGALDYHIYYSGQDWGYPYHVMKTDPETDESECICSTTTQDNATLIVQALLEYRH